MDVSAVVADVIVPVAFATPTYLLLYVPPLPVTSLGIVILPLLTSVPAALLLVHLKYVVFVPSAVFVETVVLPLVVFEL